MKSGKRSRPSFVACGAMQPDAPSTFLPELAKWLPADICNLTPRTGSESGHVASG
jgi:hypothetical protein